MRYLALLRGINVGGHGLIKMNALRDAFSQSGFHDVSTFIQSGNVFFSSDTPDRLLLAEKISSLVKTNFGIVAGVAVFSKPEWQRIIEQAPVWWGKRPDWKHNLLVMIGSHDMSAIVRQAGELKAAIEAMEPGNGVLYQSLSLKSFGRTTTGKLSTSPLRWHMTVRSYNTALKLGQLFD